MGAKQNSVPAMTSAVLVSTLTSASAPAPASAGPSDPSIVRPDRICVPCPRIHTYLNPYIQPRAGRQAPLR
ncbi:hypothetical protein B0T19DRAFT_409052 [Cercophora scortea]|uniref:Uncharacterized protein n=1 Tax=Cercophora scortea TaxID=314031 RepID=A0AAE0J4U6_9PEZI|nr:hypothetical protein B0T19DRAFT_409052 [Cercophora scortea]